MFMKQTTLAISFIACMGLVIYGLLNPVDAHNRDNCECSELRAIRRILEQQFNVVCDERRCLPVPTPTVPTGSELP
jgi:hypothetical protein